MTDLNYITQTAVSFERLSTAKTNLIALLWLMSCDVEKVPGTRNPMAGVTTKNGNAMGCFPSGNVFC